MTDHRGGAAEFDLISSIRARAAAHASLPNGVVLGIGDDAAIVEVPAGKQLAIATDTLNAGIHFPFDTHPADIGWKALAVNLSDLAAMGAQPSWCTLSLSLPGADPRWLEAFLDGFLELAGLHQVALIGGDTTRGPLSISVTVHGLVDPGRALRRDGARVGDEIWVTGTLGDAAGALRLLLASDVLDQSEATPKAPGGVARALRARLDRPSPRVDTGLALASLAHAAIDLSDGLLADLGHLCRASKVAAELQLEALPASRALDDAFAPAQRHVLQTSGGDDYELCFTAPLAAREAIIRLAIDTGVALTPVGRVLAGEGVQVIDGVGQFWQPPARGYVHFAN